MQNGDAWTISIISTFQPYIRYSGPGPFVPESEKPLENQFGNEVELIDGDDDVEEEVLWLGDFLEIIASYQIDNNYICCILVKKQKKKVKFWGRYASSMSVMMSRHHWCCWQMWEVNLGQCGRDWWMMVWCWSVSQWKSYIYIYIGSSLIKEDDECPCDSHGSGVQDSYKVAWEDWCKTKHWKMWAEESLRFIYRFSYLM